MRCTMKRRLQTDSGRPDAAAADAGSGSAHFGEINARVRDVGAVRAESDPQHFEEPES